MGVLDILFPKICFGCGKEGIYLCPDCLKKEEIVEGYLPKSVPILNGLTSLYRYRGGVRKAILALKYKFAADIAKELGLHAAQAVKSEKTFPEGRKILIPIPIFKTRENWRGFNQTEEIGKALATTLGWGFRTDLLVKLKSTAPQTGLSGKRRIENLRSSFGVKPRTILGYSQVVLFDDVWTTGSTLNEAARVLQEAGAKQVWGLTLAKG
jgi:ComF family protein